jgi:hypothetical protein
VTRVSVLEEAHRTGELDDLAYYVQRSEISKRLDRPVVGVFAKRGASPG